MKKRLMFCVAMLSIVTAVLAQDAKVVAIADSLTRVSLYDNNGWGGTPKAWTLQEHLNKVATNDDLVALARSHRNGAARATAFRLLVARGDSRYRDILYSSLQDTACFRVQSFDVIYPSNVASYMVDVLTCGCLQFSRICLRKNATMSGYTRCTMTKVTQTHYRHSSAIVAKQTSPQ